MGTVYARGKWLWLGFRDASGKWVYRSSGLPVGQEKRAKLALASIEGAISQGDQSVAGDLHTVASFCAQWVASRRARKVWSVRDDEQRMRDHVLPELGSMRLLEVRAVHVRACMAKVMQKDLAPRTVMNVYGALHRLFADAVAHEVALNNPCVMQRHELPGRVDADDEWRQTAVFTRAEVEALITKRPEIPADRRVLYALGFLAGLREGEISALKWRALDKAAPVLGSLHITRSYSRKNKQVKVTKTKVQRLVPVHPWLASVLAEWELQGWREFFGRAPGPEDLLLPNRAGRHLTDNNVLDGLAIDLGRLGFRERRFHDARRTFISLAQVDGAAPHVLKPITHGTKMGGMLGDYTSLPWATLCSAVSCLQLGPREGAVSVLPTLLTTVTGGNR